MYFLNRKRDLNILVHPLTRGSWTLPLSYHYFKICTSIYAGWDYGQGQDA